MAAQIHTQPTFGVDSILPLIACSLTNLELRDQEAKLLANSGLRSLPLENAISGDRTDSVVTIF
jgi:hypothetical protein